MTIIKGVLASSTDAARRKARIDERELMLDRPVFALLQAFQPFPAGVHHCEWRRDIEPSEAEIIADCILRK